MFDLVMFDLVMFRIIFILIGMLGMILIRWIRKPERNNKYEK